MTSKELQAKLNWLAIKLVDLTYETVTVSENYTAEWNGIPIHLEQAITEIENTINIIKKLEEEGKIENV